MLHDWTILIATLGRRQHKLESLLECLMPQVDAACGQVSVLALRNHGERPLGRVRQDLLEAAATEYVCFIDDDDRVPEYYVKRVLQELQEGPDYVGWKVKCIFNGAEWPLPAYHSLRYGRWYEDGTGYCRDISHINPVRRELTAGTSFCAGWPEDRTWVDQMRGRLTTERYIDDFMYFYHHSSSDTVQDGMRRRERHSGSRAIRWPSPNFTWHLAST